MQTQQASRAGGALERSLFVAATLASAFLLLLVQPMVGKRILPWFGGAPASQPIGGGRVAAWLLLPGVAVVVLMGVTNKVTLDVASVPFLWVLPLGTYLLSFIVAFASERNYRRPPFVVLAAAAFAVTAGVPLWQDWIELEPGGAFLSLAVQIPAYCALLFGLGMVLHGELFRLRPEADRLIAFYLCVAGGGVLGGIAVGIGAPMVFDDYYELPLGLALAAACLLSVCTTDPKSSLYHARSSRWPWAGGFVTGSVLPVDEGFGVERV